jgi:hypothetical protein
MIDNKKQGVEFENMLGPFQLYDASRSSFTIPSKTKCLFPQIFEMKGVHKSGMGYVLHLLPYTIINNVT